MAQLNDTQVIGNLHVTEDVQIGNMSVTEKLDELNTNIDDNSNAIVELNNKLTKHTTIVGTVSDWGNINLNLDVTKYIVKSIYNSDKKYLVFLYVTNGLWSCTVRKNSYNVSHSRNDNDDLRPAFGETVTLEVYYEEL